MDNLVLLTERTEMKFPLQFINPRIIVDAIGDTDTIRFMDTVPTMEYTEIDAHNFISFLKYTKKSETELELGVFDIQNNKFIGMCSLENINSENTVCDLKHTSFSFIYSLSLFFLSFEKKSAFRALTSYFSICML